MYVSYNTRILDNGEIQVDKTEQLISYESKSNKKLGVMLVGLGGNNGSTFVAGLLANRKNLTWKTKEGEQKVEFLGSLSQMGSVHIGYDTKGKAHSRLFKEMVPLYVPNDIMVGGWDICCDDLYTAAVKAKVIEPALLDQMKKELSEMVPLPSVFNSDFVASNQQDRANNIIYTTSLRSKIDQLKSDIIEFKSKHDLPEVVVLWTASTERFNRGKWSNAKELMQAVEVNDPEIPPSILFAIASIETRCIFLNGSPQNTLVSPVIELAKKQGTFVGGEDFKTGQTKLKSALVDWLTSSGIRPLSIVSYNHLGNNDGKNLSEAPQFYSKELTKKSVIDDIVEGNPVLFSSGKPDHTIVIKYVPSVGDSKRALDEYYSQLFLGGKHTLSLHNTCEDSLLAVPLMLDLVIFAEFLSRIRVNSLEGKTAYSCLDTALSPLSFFFKAPITNKGEPVVNSFFKQRYGLENLFRVLSGLPPLDHISLPNHLKESSKT